jgi:GNAT superfamily N-acetyltransferase
MNEKHPENAAIEKIVETQEESEQDDEITLRLFVNEEIVSWAKTLLYSFLKEIHTARKEKRKGYGRKLLAYIEKNAKAYGATTMNTSGIDPCNDEAIGFFRSMGYGLRPIEDDATGFLEGTKRLESTQRIFVLGD